MAEFIGLFGRVADVKAVKSLGVCREDKEFYMRRSQTRTLLRLIERGIVRIEQ